MMDRDRIIRTALMRYYAELRVRKDRFVEYLKQLEDGEPRDNAIKRLFEMEGEMKEIETMLAGEPD